MKNLAREFNEGIKFSSFRRANLDRSQDIQGSKERVDTTASRLMGSQGPGLHVHERSRAQTGKGSQPRCRAGWRGRMWREDETVTSAFQSREAI